MRAGWIALAVVAAECVRRLTVARGRPVEADAAGEMAPSPALWTVAATALVLSAGRRLALPLDFEIPLPYALLHGLVPGCSSSRSPLRFSLVVAAMLAPIAGIAVARWTRHVPATARAVVAVVLV